MLSLPGRSAVARRGWNVPKRSSGRQRLRPNTAPMADPHHSGYDTVRVRHYGGGGYVVVGGAMRRGRGGHRPLHRKPTYSPPSPFACACLGACVCVCACACVCVYDVARRAIIIIYRPRRRRRHCTNTDHRFPMCPHHHTT